MSEEKIVKVSISMPVALLAAVRKRARLEDVSVSKLVRDGLRVVMKRGEGSER